MVEDLFDLLGLEFRGFPLECDECRYDGIWYSNCPACDMKALADYGISLLERFPAEMKAEIEKLETKIA